MEAGDECVNIPTNFHPFLPQGLRPTGFIVRGPQITVVLYFVNPTHVFREPLLIEYYAGNGKNLNIKRGRGHCHHDPFPS